MMHNPFFSLKISENTEMMSVNKTTSCPKNQYEWHNRASSFKCAFGKPYVCVPDETFTNLVELCHTNTGMQKGEKIANI